MDTHLILKAQQRAYKKTAEIVKSAPIPTPLNLDEVRSMRMKERDLEKIAPSTGYADLDRIIKGFIPGHLYTLTGTTNIGKTSIACNFAVRVAYQLKKVLYIALEPENTVIEYIASVYHDKRFDELSADDLDMMGLPISVLGKEAVNSTEKLIEILEHLERYDLVVIDHIGYFINSQNNPFQQQSNTIKMLVGIAKKKQCAILLIAHLRKSNAKQKTGYVPTSDDISGSGAFKQDSTEVMIVTREMKSDDPNEVQYANYGRLYVTKTKAGPNGSIGLNFSDRKANIVSDNL